MECCFDRVAGLERKITSPGYVFENSILKEKIQQMRQALPACQALCFAMKANPFLVEALNSQVERFEVCSPGEYEICHARGIAPEKIIVSGVNKTPQSMERILELGGGREIFTLESRLQYEILSRLAEEQKLKLRVMIRLSSGNQFGVDRENLEAILEDVLKNDQLIFVGIHYFSGTQKKLKKIQKELDMLEQLGTELKERYCLKSLELEYGPGLAVAYFEGDKIPSSQEQLTQLNEMLAQLKAFDRIGIEMGRFIAASCGFFLTKVVDIKNTEGAAYVIVDGGIHQLHYFGQMMGMKIPPIRQIPEREGERAYILCGSLCTVNDVMVRDVKLHPLEIGDYLVFGACGAYSMTEGSALFLSRELPGIYEHMENGCFRCLRECSETYLLNTLSK